MHTSKYTPIGTIKKKKGVKGEMEVFFELESTSKKLQKKLQKKLIYVQQTDSQPLPYFIQKLDMQGNGQWIMRLKEIDSPEKAASFTGKTLCLPAKERPILPTESPVFSWQDLRGFLLIDEKLGELGKVFAVEPLPQQKIARFKYQDKEILLPLNKHFVRRIDQEKQIAWVRLPNGLLTTYLSSS